LRRLTLICHAATAATRAAAFPIDEPIDERTLRTLPVVSAAVREATHCWTSPALRAVQTAEALGLRATSEPLLRDGDFGRWAGRTLKDVERDEPEAVAQWLSDPAAAPHGGESIVDVVSRAAAWLSGLDDLSGQVVAVTHQAVIRAVVVNALGAPPGAFWRIDVPPLASVTFSGHALTLQLDR